MDQDLVQTTDHPDSFRLTTRPYLESVLTALQRNPLSVTGPESDPGLTMTRTSNGLALHHRFSPEVPVMEENVERQVFSDGDAQMLVFPGQTSSPSTLLM